LNEYHLRLSGLPHEAIPEVSEYLRQSFGDRERIDYGSGHELNFMCWLLCLRQLHLLTQEDYKSLVLVVFNKCFLFLSCLYRYLTLTRRIQTLYLLEPAGSHGVWGLDDYSFLPYLFGSSQLLHHPRIRPKSIHVAETVEFFSQKYMYLGCIAQINSVKTVGLRWHSPMLDDISGVKSWTKVHEGMGKMFRGEVLGKRTVMQHFLFGRIIPPPEGLGQGPRDEGAEERGHVHEMFGDCCGIRVPSSVAARRELESKGFKGEGALPFD
jgi:serine/threonine-protein phosphatase 2A activator